MVIGHTQMSLEELAKKIGATNINDVLRFLDGKDFAKAQWGLIDKLGGAKAQLARNAAGNPTIGAKVARFAGGKSARNLLRAVPGLSTALVALDVADVVAGPDSLGNKGMDAVAMGIGGTLGAVGGPLGIAAGAGLGKMASDATQFVFGGGKSAEQRKLEEALKLLQQRGLV
jgi:hypothetical protein